VAEKELSTDQHRFRTLVVEVLDAIDAAEVAQDVKLVSNSSAVDALRRTMTGW
jgi:hypothetical protein